MNCRVFIGRSVNESADNTTTIAELETSAVVTAALEHLPVDAFTAYEGMGYWRGGCEQSVIIEVCGIDRATVESIQKAAPGLARALHQTSVYMTAYEGAAVECFA